MRSFSDIYLRSMKSTEHRGQELLEQGLSIAIPAKPGAVVITYAKKPL